MLVSGLLSSTEFNTMKLKLATTVLLTAATLATANAADTPDTVQRSDLRTSVYVGFSGDHLNFYNTKVQPIALAGGKAKATEESVNYNFSQGSYILGAEAEYIFSRGKKVSHGLGVEVEHSFGNYTVRALSNDSSVFEDHSSDWKLGVNYYAEYKLDPYYSLVPYWTPYFKLTAGYQRNSYKVIVDKATNNERAVVKPRGFYIKGTVGVFNDNNFTASLNYE